MVVYFSEIYLIIYMVIIFMVILLVIILPIICMMFLSGTQLIYKRTPIFLGSPINISFRCGCMGDGELTVLLLLFNNTLILVILLTGNIVVILLIGNIVVIAFGIGTIGVPE